MTDAAFQGDTVVVRRPSSKLEGLAQAFLWLTSREFRLVRKYHALQREGPRSTPGVLIDGESRAVGITSAPTRMNPNWVLANGQEVTTREIQDLNTVRFLSGYD